jgi:hypothetical protein
VPGSLPSPLDTLGGRSFSFFPPILNVAHNQWIYRESTWSEFCVVNAATGAEVWIPRMFLGEISRVGDPLAIVGLRKELEWKGGIVSAMRRTVIEMPLAVNDVPRPARAASLAPVVPIRLESPAASRRGRKIGVALMLGAVCLTFVADIARQINWQSRAEAFRFARAWRHISPGDTMPSVVARLGTPSDDRTFTNSEGLRFRVLSWPKRGLKIVLMATGHEDEHYLGTVGSDGQVLQFVQVSGEDVPQLLRAAVKF